MSWQAREIVPSLEEAAKHHFNEMWYYDVEFYHDPKRRAEYLDRVRKEHPDFYHTYIAGSKKVSAEWYKQMQQNIHGIWKLKWMEGNGMAKY